MEKTTTIIESIKATNERINTLENEIANASYKEKRIDPVIIEKCSELQTLKIAVKIMKDNYRNAFATESMPIVKSIIGKYAGKKYGEKTKEKIRNEFYENGIYFYVNGYSSLGDDINIQPVTDRYSNDYIVIKYPYKTHFADESNKIMSLPDDIKISVNNYINDPIEHAKNIIAKFNELKIKYDDFSNMLYEYNSMLPQNMKQPYISGFNTYLDI